MLIRVSPYGTPENTAPIMILMIVSVPSNLFRTGQWISVPSAGGANPSKNVEQASLNAPDWS